MSAGWNGAHVFGYTLVATGDHARNLGHGVFRSWIPQEMSNACDIVQIHSPSLRCRGYQESRTRNVQIQIGSRTSPDLSPTSNTPVGWSAVRLGVTFRGRQIIVARELLPLASHTAAKDKSSFVCAAVPCVKSPGCCSPGRLPKHNWITIVRVVCVICRSQGCTVQRNRKTASWAA